MERVRSFLEETIASEYEYTDVRTKDDLDKFLFIESRRVLKQVFKRWIGKSIKFNIAVCVRMERLHVSEQTGVVDSSIVDPWLHSSNEICFPNQSQLDETLDQQFAEIINAFQLYTKNGSGFVLVRIMSLRLNICRYYPLSGGSLCRKRSRTNMLPSYIWRKRAIYRFINAPDTEQCFVHCLRASYHLRHGNNQYRFWLNFATLPRYEDVIDTAKLSFPTPLTQISMFTDHNPCFHIVVFGLDSKRKVSPRNEVASINVLYHPKKPIQSDQIPVDLLYHANHYYLVHTLSRLVGTRTTRAKVCRSCLLVFRRQMDLDAHSRFCDQNGTIYKPAKNLLLKFTKLASLCSKSFAIYWDAEVIQQPVQADSRKKVHIIAAIGAKRICFDDSRHNSSLFLAVGENCVEQFLDFLEQMALEIQLIYDECYQPLVMTEKDWDSFMAAERCYMCQSTFNETNPKFRDHDHLFPKYRGALCNACNLGRATQVCRDVPLFSHNGSKYDHSLIIRKMNERVRNNGGRLKCVSKSTECNIAIFYRQYILLDSMNFLSSSLAELIRISLQEELQHPHLLHFPLLYDYVEKSREKYDLLLGKQNMCFAYLTSFDVLKDRRLPEANHFFNDLTKEPISQVDYHHALLVWKTFQCQTLEDYLKIYLACDVLYLASIFERYRRVGMRDFGIDCTYYMSSAQYSFHCCLRYTQVELRLLDDPEMWNWIRRGVRGGITNIVTRYAKANLPTLPDYNPCLPKREMIYLDCRSMYGFALKQPLPVGDYVWLTDAEVKSFDIARQPTHGIGYIAEVDIEFPTEVHDYLAEFPPLATHSYPNPDEWSDYQRQLAEKTGQIKTALKTPKLLSDLRPKQHYVAHVKLLKTCLQLGAKVTRVHRILQFTERPWARPYIEFLEEKRRNSTSGFESNYYKLAVNSIFGFTLSDVTKRHKTHLVNDSKRFLSLTRKPNFRRFTIYDRKLVNVQMQPACIEMTSPILIGQSILDRSKLTLISFFYHFLKRKYGSQAQLAFQDTDSLAIIWSHQTMTAHQMMYTNRKYFDLSELPETSGYRKMTNAKRAGTFKVSITTPYSDANSPI